MLRQLLKPSIYWLLPMVAVAFVLRFIPALSSDVALFVCAALGIIPLAALMGEATENLGTHFGQGVGGLLNATFGNAAELIIALFALRQGLHQVVKASITGSIIGNILLVLGMSVFFGGLKHKHQSFNRTAVRTAATSLLLAAMALFTPTIFHTTAAERPGGWSRQTEQNLSLGIAVILFITYGCVLLFSLKTHKQLFQGEHEETAPEKVWSKSRALVVLLLATVATAFLAEFLVGTIESARRALGLTETFVGIIIVAVVGNAAEHATAVLVAMKNKMDLSLSVALGSSLQVALFVAPVLIFSSYLFGKPMDLEFTVPELFAVIASVYIAGQISGDGESNWLEGVQLLAAYLVLVVLFYFLPAH